MKNLLLCGALVAGAVGVSMNAHAVEYVKICSAFGAGFNYVPGWDICHNATTGDARQETEDDHVWRTILPYPEGDWTTHPKEECKAGKLVKLGTFDSSDFELNDWQRKQTAAINPKLKADEFVTKVIMSGGFYDPRIPDRHGVNGSNGLCVRSIDPGSVQYNGAGAFNPPWGNGMLPVGCIANSRIVGMPAAYAISATSAYPSVDTYFIDADQTVNGPYPYGSRLVITTDIFAQGEGVLTYYDVEDETHKPMAGELTVSVCVEKAHKNGEVKH